VDEEQEVVSGGTMSPLGDYKGSPYGVASGILGWILEAYEFFVAIFIVDILAKQFQVSKSVIIFSFTATLAMRPVGAFIGGILADRFGRRVPLLFIVAYFVILSVLSGAAQNYSMFIVVRALYGIGMGGFWGVGASLALESAPQRWRGALSGVIQAGYSFGYLLAAVATRVVLPIWGWRSMYWVGVLPALLTFFVIYKSSESEAWRQRHSQSIRGIIRVLWDNKKTLAYLVFALTLMIALSHGTQDLYPDFLKTRNISADVVAEIAIGYSIGAVLGAIFVGQSSEVFGRRRTIIAALVLCVLAIPLWAFGKTTVILAVAAFVMQVGVSGAWGVIPAHLSELAPDTGRALFAGLAYQFGVLFGSPAGSIEYALKNRIGYEWSLAIFEGCTVILLMIAFSLGPERKGRNFRRALIDETAKIEGDSPLGFCRAKGFSSDG
jgi:MFS transporter, SHS family, lactate transporter